MGSGGSSGLTLAAIEKRLRDRLGALDVTFIDTQPWHLRTGGTTRYDGLGKVRVATPDEAGQSTRTRSQTINLILNGGPVAYRGLIAQARRMLGGRHDALIVCHDRNYPETALIRAARAMGTPSVLVQEGPFCAIGRTVAQSPVLRIKAALAPLPVRLGLLPDYPPYGLAGHALILAVSERYRDRWVAAGVSADRIMVTGVPRFDGLTVHRQSPGLGRHPGPLRITYVVQPFAAHGKVDRAAAEQAQTMLAQGLNLAVRRGPIEVTARLHPRSGGDDIAVLRSALSVPLIEDRGGRPFEAALADIDLVVGHYSTALLEAMLAGRDILIVPIPGQAFAERGEADKQAWLTGVGAPVANDPVAVADAVDQCRGGDIQPPDWLRIGEETGVVDGGATDRCADAILSLISGGGR